MSLIAGIRVDYEKYMRENLNIKAKVQFIPPEHNRVSRIASVQMSAGPHYMQIGSEFHARVVLVPRDSVSVANWKADCQLWALQIKCKTPR
jgi:hypothetical protein